MAAEIGDSFATADITTRISLVPNTTVEYSGTFGDYNTLYEAIIEGLAAGNPAPAGTGAITGLFFFDDVLYAARTDGTGSKLYKTTTNVEITANPSWEAVDMGHSVQFEDLTQNFTTFYDRKFLEASVATPDPMLDLLPSELESVSVVGQVDAITNPFPRDSWFPLDGTIDGTENTPISYTSSGLLWNPSPILRLKGFINSEDVPEKVNIVGIRVDVRSRYEMSCTGGSAPNLKGKMKLARLIGVGTTDNEAPATEVTGTNTISGSFATTTLGGSTNTWSATKLTRSNLISEDFGVELQWDLYSGGTLGTISKTIEVAWVKVSIYYENADETVYFWDGVTDVASGDVVNVCITDGSVASENADGFVTLYNVTGSGEDVSDVEIRTAASGGGEVLGTAQGLVVPNRLPTAAQMSEAKAMLVGKEINFFIDPEKNAFYGATGAGPAFHFNGTHFWFIRTPVPVEKDKPRYIIDNQNSLVLSYDSGSILLSPPGRPSVFSGVLGATEFGFFGRPITGMLKLSGTALGIWTDRSIEALVGTTINNYTTQTISDSTGAINYTVVDAGQPLFTDFRGISNVQAAQTYGDFSWGRLSQLISPLLQEKIQEQADPFALNEKVVAAVAVKNKGQYRLYFADGDVHILTLYGADGASPMFTRQNFGTDAYPTEFVPTALASTVLESGQEIIALGNAEGHVFILDQGNPGIARHDGLGSFNYSVTFNPFVGGVPFANVKVAEVMIHMRSAGYEQLEAQAGLNFLIPTEEEYADTLILGSADNIVNLARPFDRVSAHLPNITDGFSVKISGATGTRPWHNIQALTYKVTGLTDANSSPKTY